MTGIRIVAPGGCDADPCRRIAILRPRRHEGHGGGMDRGFPPFCLWAYGVRLAGRARSAPPQNGMHVYDAKGPTGTRCIINVNPLFCDIISPKGKI